MTNSNQPKKCGNDICFGCSICTAPNQPQPQSDWTEKLKAIHRDYDRTYDLIFDLLLAQQSLHEAELERVGSALWLILPMAKAYAAENNVGNNQKFVDDAVEIANQIMNK